MRILLFGVFIDYQIRLANALCESENTSVVLVFPINKLPDECCTEINKNVYIYILGSGKKLYDLRNIKNLRNLVKFIDEYNPDIIHIQGTHLVLGAVLPFIKRYPLVNTYHDVKLHSGVKMWSVIRVKTLRYFLNKYTDHVFVHGEKLKEEMLTEYNFPEDNIHVITIGEYEVSIFKKYAIDNLDEDENSVLFFGRIQKYKGLDYLVRAEPIITKEVPDAKIIIAGMGEGFHKYERIMTNKDKFEIYNYRIPYEEGAKLFQRCSLVVLPYIDASQSGIIPVAYGFKKPVVVTNVGSIPEIVDDGITGYIVPPRDSEALARAIVKLLNNETLRKRMGENAYKKLKTDMSWGDIARKTIIVYERAIEDAKR